MTDLYEIACAVLRGQSTPPGSPVSRHPLALLPSAPDRRETDSSTADRAVQIGPDRHPFPDPPPPVGSPPTSNAEYLGGPHDQEQP